MGIVALVDLKPGMELQTALVSKQGRQLLPPGICLSQKHIQTMKIWGIIEAEIAGEGEEDSTQRRLNDLPEELVERSKKHTLHHFRNTDTKHPAVKGMAQLYLLRIANELYTTKDWEKRFPIRQDTEPVELNRQENLSLDRILSNDLKLASLPEIFHQIIAAINDPKTSASHIADIVSKDTSLSAKLLKIVNSPYYGFSENIDTLSRALALVGTNKLTNLALGISAMDTFKDIPSDLFDMHSFWRHSITCALTSSWLASHADDSQEESFFVSGLLHDIGWLIMLKLHPDACQEVLKHKGTTTMAPHELERAIWGFDHAKLGGLVLEEWKLPPSLTKAVKYHHEPNKSQYDYSPSVLHVGDITAHALDKSLNTDSMPPMRGGAWGALGVSKNILAAMALSIDSQLSEILGAFFDGRQ